MRRYALIVFAPVLVCALVAATRAAAQGQQWQWPEKPKNLKVLPKDFTGERLRPVMLGFVNALGVRCSHCHVGEEGAPLTTYDFASDDNPKKGIARDMLKMLGTIHDDLDKMKLEGDHRVNMWCHTCHRGRPRPMTLAEELGLVADTAGVGAAVARYHELREEFYGRGAYDFGENSLNRLGYELLGKDDHEGAIRIFRLNAQQHPESGNVYDSLAEAYMTAGHKELAIIYYEKSLLQNPDNRNAIRKLRELRGKGESSGD